MDRDDEPAFEETARWLMGQPQGRQFLRELARITGFAHEVFDKQTSQMAHAAGKRTVFVELAAKLKGADPNAYANILGDIL